jgi:hypothetical protein
MPCGGNCAGCGNGGVPGGATLQPIKQFPGTNWCFLLGAILLLAVGFMLVFK